MLIHQFQRRQGKTQGTGQAKSQKASYPGQNARDAKPGAGLLSESRASSGPFLVRSLGSRLRSHSPHRPLSHNLLGILLVAAVAGTFLGWAIFSSQKLPPTSTRTPVQELAQESEQAESKRAEPKQAESKRAESKRAESKQTFFSGLFKGSSVQADPDDYFSEGILPDTAIDSAADPSVKSNVARPRLKVPQQIAPGTVVWVGGDPSLIRLSELLRYEFQRRFPGSEVDVRTADTATALANVLDGSLDVAAISRPLTPAEEAQGLVAVPLARHKIAVLIGPDNPFEGSLTNLQLAQILRGEITRWSQVGGQDAPLRLVDRKANSATREALIRYPMFAGVDKTTGAPAGRSDRLSDVAKTLGVDGITYALIDQVSDDIVNPDQVSRGDVKIVPLHQVMPDDPRYSISQPMVYVYRGPNPSPKAEAFMAYATVLRGRGLLADGASLNARGTWLDNWAVRGVLLMGGSMVLVSTIANLRQDNLQSARLRADLMGKSVGHVSVSNNEESKRQALRDLEFYDERTSTHLLLSLQDPNFPDRDFPDRDFQDWDFQARALPDRSFASSHLPEGRVLWARWMVADQQRASLPLEQGGGLEVRLYEYHAQEAIPAEATDSAKLGSIARHRPFLAYPCDGPEGCIALHPRNSRPGMGYIAELGYLAADNRWTKVATSTFVRLPIQTQVLLR